MAYHQGTFSLLFFIGTVLVAFISVSGFLESSDTIVATEPESKDVSIISQNFHHDINRIINKNIIPLHLKAYYQYLAMATYFERADVALPGFSKYSRNLSERHLDNANFLMSYLNKRGGSVEFRNIEAPSTDKWLNGLDALYDILEREKKLNVKLRYLHRQASKRDDPHTTHTIEDKLLDGSVTLIKELGDHIQNLENMSIEDYGLAEYIFDKDL